MRNILAAVLLCFALQVFAESPIDSSNVESDNIIFDTDIFDSKPFIRFDIGVTQPLYRGFQGDDLDQFSALIGFEKNSIEGESLLGYSNYGIFGFILTDDTELLATQTENAQQFSLGAIGIANTKGYGWNFGGKSKLTLGVEDGTGFAQLGYNYDVPQDPDPYIGVFADRNAYENLQNTFGDDTRWTQYFRSYIKYQPIDLVSLDISYGRQVIYPRLLFWYWAASGIVSGSADVLADIFINRVLKSYENAVPVVHFILKTGLAFAFYQLQKDNMHWPINTAPALVTNNFNIGFAFHF